MVLQITRYETKKATEHKVGESLSYLKEFYMNNGCKYYEVFNDCFTENCILEVTRFDNEEKMHHFETMDSPEKKKVYDQFYSDNNVIAKSQEVRFEE